MRTGKSKSPGFTELVKAHQSKMAQAHSTVNSQRDIRHVIDQGSKDRQCSRNDLSLNNEGQDDLDRFDVPQDGIMINVNPMDDNFLSDQDVSHGQDMINEHKSDGSDDSSSESETESESSGSEMESGEVSDGGLDKKRRRRMSNSSNKQLTILAKLADLKDDPEVEDYINQLVQKNLRKSLEGKQKEQNGSKVQTPNNKIVMVNKIANNRGDIAKSPSDMTLYTPALNKGVREVNMVDRISNFVEEIRLENGNNHYDYILQVNYTA